MLSLLFNFMCLSIWCSVCWPLWLFVAFERVQTIKCWTNGCFQVLCQSSLYEEPVKSLQLLFYLIHSLIAVIYEVNQIIWLSTLCWLSVLSHRHCCFSQLNTTRSVCCPHLVFGWTVCEESLAFMWSVGDRNLCWSIMFWFDEHCTVNRK